MFLKGSKGVIPQLNKTERFELLVYYLMLTSDVYLTSRNLLTADLQDEAAVVENTHAPPATVLLHRLHDQIPTQDRFIAS